MAPIPIARLLDSDRYGGTNPAVTAEPLIGLAEYTNANFFSEDRIWPNDPRDRFPYPARSSVRPARSQIRLPSDDLVGRWYYEKVAHGETGYRLATVSFLREYFVRYRLDPERADQNPALDEIIYRDYATRLLPRAVGYSAAALDYFFRGRLEARLDDGLRLRNRTPGELMRGDVALYYDATDGTRVHLTTWESLSLAPDIDAPPLPVPPHRPDKPPLDPQTYWLVFRGWLGAEPNAVVAMRLRRTPVILVFFSHQGGWARQCAGGGSGRYAEGLEAYFGPTPASVPLIDPYGCPIGALEQIFYALWSTLVPDDPAAPLTSREVPWAFVKFVEVTPAPVYPDWANLRSFVNYMQLGLSMTGRSVVETDDSWRLTVVWADWVATWAGAEAFLGRTPDGDIDVSPRVVKVCPGHEWASPYGGTLGPFGPHSLTRPKIYHCPDWWVFGD